MASKPATSNYPTWLAREERQSDRVAVAWSATLSTPHGDHACRIADITHLGCRIQADDLPSVGTYVTVVIPQFAGVAGWVAWRKNGEAGLDFGHPLPDAVLDEVLRRNGTLPH